ncbi:hypothetical protein SeLEV6574_g01649 [Synchytrium endobioticum]|uniref:Uncharacterized protein n=1 Tax=Synchytrium endobioticum TaxID=286115 RepID=A0A507DBR6_9FUNG|nr:hypothetical protein SeLEV6574_g01649 [Synchytrium endobioticum]
MCLRVCQRHPHDAQPHLKTPINDGYDVKSQRSIRATPKSKALFWTGIQTLQSEAQIVVTTKEQVVIALPNSTPTAATNDIHTTHAFEDTCNSQSFNNTCNS